MRIRRPLSLLLTPLALLGAAAPAIADPLHQPNPTPLWQAHPLGTEPLATTPARTTTTAGGAEPPATAPPAPTTGGGAATSAATTGGGAATPAPPTSGPTRAPAGARKAAKPAAGGASVVRPPKAASASTWGWARWAFLVVVAALALAPLVLLGRRRAGAVEAEAVEPQKR